MYGVRYFMCHTDSKHFILSPEVHTPHGWRKGKNLYSFKVITNWVRQFLRVKWVGGLVSKERSGLKILPFHDIDRFQRVIPPKINYSLLLVLLYYKNHSLGPVASM